MSAKECFHMIYSFGKVEDVYYPRLVWGDAERTKKSRVLWSWGCLPRPSWLISILTAPGFLWIFSVRDVGEHLQLCSLLFSFFIFSYPGRVCWEHMPFFSLDWNSCSHKTCLWAPKQALKPVMIYIFTHCFSINTFNASHSRQYCRPLCHTASIS